MNTWLFWLFLETNIPINGHIITWIRKFFKISAIAGIVFAILVSMRKRNKINNCLIIWFREFLAQTNFICLYTTTKILLSLIKTAFFFWRENIKVSLCTSHWTWTCPTNSWRDLFLYYFSSNSPTITYARV